MPGLDVGRLWSPKNTSHKHTDDRSEEFLLNHLLISSHCSVQYGSTDAGASLSVDSLIEKNGIKVTHEEPV